MKIEEGRYLFGLVKKSMENSFFILKYQTNLNTIF